MKRFRIHPRQASWKWPAISLGVFLGVLALFLTVLGDFSDDTSRRQRQAMERALNRGIVSCYALEGRYPQSLEYLQRNYQFVYDQERYVIDYQLLGDNIMPEVTILERGE